MNLPHLKNLLLLLFLFSFTAAAQINIHGRIINGKTVQPVQGASVYFNSTSIGTSSDATGQFSINATEVNTELIISCVGYETIVYKPDASAINNKPLLFKLKVKEQQLGEVLVVPDAVRKRWLTIFKSNFLGVTEEASKSNIANLKEIYFMKGEGRNGFKAYCDSVLVITNKMLGYKISFDLVEFSIDDEKGTTYFYGFTRYEELGDKKKWVKNRRGAYYGSTMHFYRSLIDGNTETEGYKMYLLKPVKIKADTIGASGNVLSVKSGKKNEMVMAINITPGQIFGLDSTGNAYLLSLTGQLMVQYSKEPSSKEYLKEHVFVHGNLPVGFRAFIKINAPSVKIYEEGIVDDPTVIEYSGYWMYEKAANLLPLNYKPD